MKVMLKKNLLIVVPEALRETEDLAAWKANRHDHVFYVSIEGEGLAFGDLGTRDAACNVPVVVASDSPDPAARLISNFAPTPFTLDGRVYACVEAFWQALKFAEESDRHKVAVMDGRRARRAGQQQGYGATVTYQGQEIPVGTYRHWELMERACWAKFTQNASARDALLSTGDRPLQHRVRRDSRTIPRAIMAEIWMRIRSGLRSNALPLSPATRPHEPARSYRGD